MDIRIRSRMYPRGFDISTPVENLSTKSSPFDGTLVLNASGTQIARVGKASFFSGAYDIIISGGGFYQFDRDKNARRTWACKGEGRSLNISEHRGRKFEIVDEVGRIAEFSKAWSGNDYAITLLNEAEWKLVICTILALSLRDHQFSDIPG